MTASRDVTDPVVIVPYDSDWPRQFEQERKLLAEVFLGTRNVVVHIGSTAVPGLGGKPVIDIMVGVAALSDVERRIPDLEVRGYEYVPEYEDQLPERRYFRKPRDAARTHHLHCVVAGDDLWCQQLTFRDYLRAYPEAAAAYSELKQRLASRHRNDRVAYSEAKTTFVRSILVKAAAEGIVGAV
ncbi:MAG: GrpB family protein [Planctomycetota bacterium]